MEVDEARAYKSIGETRGEHCAQVTSIFSYTGKKPYIGGFFPNTKYIQQSVIQWSLTTKVLCINNNRRRRQRALTPLPPLFGRDSGLKRPQPIKL